MKIISGGQTGVDRAALDAARQLGFSIGGWCPRGGRSEEGDNLLERYSELQETPERNYKQRTRWNVRDGDATLILYRGDMSPGTALTLRLARDSGKPWLLVDLAKAGARKQVAQFLAEQSLEVLNVAGPRESGSPGIYEDVLDLLLDVFQGNF